mgnify:CR=1 FL=1|tara:strand:- start:101 stop:454 length:354 start_codon:yes stop_codon:yes gene_type:complete
MMSKLRTFTNLGALPPGKQMVKVEHTYDKTYTDYFYTVVDVTDERYVASVKTGRIACPDQLQQVRDRMAAGYMESYDSDEVDEEDGTIFLDEATYDVNDKDMKAAVDRWIEYEQDSE